MGERAPGYRVSPDHFQTAWRTKNHLYYCAQSGNSNSRVIFVCSYTRHCCLPERGFGCIRQTLHSRHQFLLVFLECGLGILFHLIFLEYGKIRLCFSRSFIVFFFFSVTLPGSHAPHSAVRGKPTLFCCFFSRFQGFLNPRFVCLPLHLVRLRSVLFGFSCGFKIFWCVFVVLGCSVSKLLKGFP